MRRDTAPRVALLLRRRSLLLVALFYLPQLLHVRWSRSATAPPTAASCARCRSPTTCARSSRSTSASSGAASCSRPPRRSLCLLRRLPGRVVARAARARPRWRSALLALVILPFWTSFLVRMYAWIVLLRSEGVVNLALAGLGPAAGGAALQRLRGAARPGLRRAAVHDHPALRLAREARPLAARGGRRPRRRRPRARSCSVVVPQTLPGIAAGCVLVFIPSLGAYLAPDLLGGGKTAYVGNLIQSQFAVARDMPFGAALSFVLSLAVLAALPRVPPAAANGAGALAMAREAVRAAAGALLGVLTAARVYLFLYAPILVLVALSFNASRLSAVVGRLHARLVLRRRPRTRPSSASLRNSLLVGASPRRSSPPPRPPRRRSPSTATASGARALLEAPAHAPDGRARDRAGRVAAAAVRRGRPAPRLPDGDPGARRRSRCPTRSWS